MTMPAFMGATRPSPDERFSGVGTGFPAPFIDNPATDPAFPNQFATAVPLAKLIDWYWNVKEWEIICDISLTVGGFTFAFFSGVLEAFVSSAFARTPENNSRLGRAHPCRMVFGPGGQMVVALFGNLGVGYAAGPEPHIARIGGVLYPAVTISSGPIGFGSLDGSVAVEFNSAASVLSSVTGSLIAHIEEYEFEVFYEASAEGDASYVINQFDLVPATRLPGDG